MAGVTPSPCPRPLGGAPPHGRLCGPRIPSSPSFSISGLKAGSPRSLLTLQGPGAHSSPRSPLQLPEWMCNPHVLSECRQGGQARPKKLPPSVRPSWRLKLSTCSRYSASRPLLQRTPLGERGTGHGTSGPRGRTVLGWHPDPSGVTVAPHGILVLRSQSAAFGVRRCQVGNHLHTAQEEEQLVLVPNLQLFPINDDFPPNSTHQANAE